MPNNWKTYSVEELINEEIIYKPLDGNHGGTHPKGSDFIKSGIPFIMATDIVNGKVDITNCKFISKEQADKLRKGFAKTGDILITHKASIGRTAIVPKIESEYIMLTPQVTYYRVRDGKKLDINYLKQYFNSPFFQNEINTRAGSGSTRAYIGITDQLKLTVSFPSIEEQQSIASILSAIDDKIENNLAINKTLEEMAMALYKNWFVDFGPLQDGKFVESEFGMIPTGWKVKKIGDVIETLGGGTPGTTVKEYWHGGDIPWYSPTDLTRENSLFSVDTAKKITSLGLQKSSAKMFPANSLLMSSRATVGLLTINTKEACTNQGFITMLPNDQLSIYQLYFWIKQSMDLIISKCNGSTFKEISKSNFRDLDIIVANNIEKYIEESRDIFEQIKNNITENKTLTQLRDTLLPQLISGTVRLKEFRKTVEEVV